MNLEYYSKLFKFMRLQVFECRELKHIPLQDILYDPQVQKIRAFQGRYEYSFNMFNIDLQQHKLDDFNYYMTAILDTKIMTQTQQQSHDSKVVFVNDLQHSKNIDLSSVKFIFVIRFYNNCAEVLSKRLVDFLNDDCMLSQFMKYSLNQQDAKQQEENILYLLDHKSLSIKAKMVIFHKAMKHIKLPFTYSFLKPFRVYTNCEVNLDDLDDVCMFLTAKLKAFEINLDLKLLESKTMEKVLAVQTWDVEKSSLRAKIGIIMSHLHRSPFDRLNGRFDNDRIVLYTYFIQNSNVETTLFFDNLLKSHTYILTSIINDVPGFAYKYNYDQLHIFLDKEMLMMYVPQKILKLNNIQMLIEHAEPLDYLQSFEFDFSNQQFPYIKTVFEYFKDYILNIKIDHIRQISKTIDVLVQCEITPQIYKFVILGLLRAFNFIIEFLESTPLIQIRDIHRISTSILGLIYKFHSINDQELIYVISLYVYYIYEAACQKLVKQNQFTIYDISLPLGFVGHQALVVYFHDIVEHRSNNEIHIVTDSRDRQIFSVEQLKTIQFSEESETTKDGKKECSCNQQLLKIVKEINDSISVKKDSYYFDSVLIQTNCPNCSQPTVKISNKLAIQSIGNGGGVDTEENRSTYQLFNNYITHFMNLDNSLEQLRTHYNFDLTLNQVVDDIFMHRNLVNKLLATDSSVIFQYNNSQEAHDNITSSSNDALDFTKIENLVKQKFDVEDEKQYDAFMSTGNLQSKTQVSKKDLATLRQKSMQEAMKAKQLSESKLTSQQRSLSDMSNVSEGKSARKQKSVRLLYLDKISQTAAMLTIFRSLLSGNLSIQKILKGKIKLQLEDAYTVFYLNEQITGNMLGLPSMMSIFINNDVNELPHTYQISESLQNILNWNSAIHKQNLNYFMTTFDYIHMAKHITSYTNGIMISMLNKVLKTFPIEQQSKQHYKKFYQNCVCVLIQSIKLNRDDSTQKIILQHIQTALNDYSNLYFYSNWFEDSFKDIRNKAIYQLANVQLPLDSPAWPDFFNVDRTSTSMTAGGLQYVPSFIRCMEKIRNLLFLDKKISTTRGLLYELIQVKDLKSRVILTKRKSTASSLQAATLGALMNNSHLLRDFLLNRDSDGKLTVKHLSVDSIQVLINNGELGLVCNWMNATFDEIMGYLNVQLFEQNYQQYLINLVSLEAKTIKKQYFLQTRLSYYYQNQLLSQILSLALTLNAITESNSFMSIPILLKIATSGDNLTGDPIFGQIRARALIQLKIILGMEVTIRSGTLIEKITFNNRKLVPLVTKVMFAQQVQIQTDIKMLISHANIEKSHSNLGLAYEKQANGVDFYKGILNNLQIFAPIHVKAQVFDQQSSKDVLSGTCQLIIDLESFNNKQMKANLIVADHQIYVYYGRKLDVYVGTISLVQAVVCLAEMKRQKFIALQTRFPRVRSYLIYTGDCIEQLYISIVSSIV